MKTLVIHPIDKSTDFLSVVYRDIEDATIIRDPYSSSKYIKDNIKSHDRIIMLGHGTHNGLIAMTGLFQFRNLIDSKLVYLLREKECISIWCNADKFLNKYGLNGFHTGMIVSEFDEAEMFIFGEYTLDQIDSSNKLFAEALKRAIDSETPLDVMNSIYIGDDPIVEFNKQNIFHTKKEDSK